MSTIRKALQGHGVVNIPFRDHGQETTQQRLHIVSIMVLGHGVFRNALARANDDDFEGSRHFRYF